MKYWPTALQPGWIDEARRITQEPAFRQVLAAGPALRGRCLNAGCGDGLYAEFLESMVHPGPIVHMDLSRPAFVDRLRNPRHQAAAGSLTKLPFEEASFDSCLCSEVLEHVPDDVQAVQELARVIKPGGTLLVSVPTPPAPPDPAHVREGYRLSDLTQLLGRHGFTVKNHAYAQFAILRVTYIFWAWQLRCLGGGQLSLIPRGVLRILGKADARWPVGKPWDLVVAAQRD